MQKTRRSKKKPYKVILGDKAAHEISRYWWDRYVSNGWLIKVSNHTAQLRDGVSGWIERGGLRLYNRITEISVWIQLNCRIIEKHAIYDVRGPRMTSDMLMRAVLRDYCVTG